MRRACLIVTLYCSFLPPSFATPLLLPPTTSLSPLKKTPMNKTRVAKNDAYSWRQSTTADRKPRYGADRSDLFEVRRAPGTRVQRRAEAYKEALLHQFRLDKLPFGGKGGKVYAISYRFLLHCCITYFTKKNCYMDIEMSPLYLGVVRTE